MINDIKTKDDVIAFARQLLNEGISFHPDDDFNDYVIYANNKRAYTIDEAENRNKMMGKCFVVCEKNYLDIYTIMNIK